MKQQIRRNIWNILRFFRKTGGRLTRELLPPIDLDRRLEKIDQMAIIPERDFGNPPP